MKFTRIFALLMAAGLITSPVNAKNDKQGQLPPGLQKKAEQGMPLPPGWQKKVAKGEVLDREIYEHGHIIVPVDSHGLITVRVEDKLLRLHHATREIIDILHE